MIKKMLLVFILFFSMTPSFAINWDRIITPTGRTVYLDLDSIREVDGYYFYNIKYQTNKTIFISTVQSGISRPFSKAIKNYSESEYDNLNGDYDNISNNMTKNLEPVTFESTINSCYKKVKSIMQLKANNISF